MLDGQDVFSQKTSFVGHARKDRSEEKTMRNGGAKNSTAGELSIQMNRVFVAGEFRKSGNLFLTKKTVRGPMRFANLKTFKGARSRIGVSRFIHGLIHRLIHKGSLEALKGVFYGES